MIFDISIFLYYNFIKNSGSVFVNSLIGDMNNIDDQIIFWEKSAKKDLDTANDLLGLKRYDACLFFCHLSLEKLLKSLVARNTQKTPPYIHDLERLAILAELDLDEDKTQNLRTITRFNIAGRYGDVKYNLYKVANKKYTEKYLEITKNLFLWLKKQKQPSNRK